MWGAAPKVAAAPVKLSLREIQEQEESLAKSKPVNQPSNFAVVASNVPATVCFSVLLATELTVLGSRRKHVVVAGVQGPRGQAAAVSGQACRCSSSSCGSRLSAIVSLPSP